MHWGAAPTPMALPIVGPDAPDTDGGASFVLFANLANTNTIAWFPCALPTFQYTRVLEYLSRYGFR